SIVINPDGTYSYTPDSGYVGIDSVVYNICDNGNPVLCDTSLLIININENNPSGNNPPYAGDDANNTNEDTPVSGNLLPNDFDPDGDSLIVNTTSIIAPLNGTVIIGSDGSYTYTPNADYCGTDQFVYEICDSGTPSYCVQATAYITINCVNDPPIANQDTISTNEDTPIVIVVLDNDTDIDSPIDTSSISIIDQPGNGVVVVDTITGSITYIPDTNFCGIDTFTYSLCDTGVPILCDTALVIVNVNCINDAPQAIFDSTAICADSTIVFNVLLNDTDVDFDSLTLQSTPLTAMNGVVSTTGVIGEIMYNPNAGFYGIDTITYIICDDGNGTLCDTGFAVVYVSPLNAIATVVTNVGCNGDSTGEISITLPGGGYSFQWSNGATTSSIDSLNSGTYNVLITDSLGCTGSYSYSINQPAAPLAVVGIVTDVLCNNGNTGAITANPSGGTSPYNIIWSIGDTTATIDSLVIGTYALTVIDFNGCSIIDSFTVNQSSGISANATVGSAACLNNLFASVAVQATGGTGLLTYSWNTGDTTATISNLIAGNYTLTITDSASCTQVFSYTVVDTSAIQITAASNTFCEGSSAELTAPSIGNANYQWYANGQLLSNQTAVTITVTDTASYYVVVSAACGLDTSASIALTQVANPVITISDGLILCQEKSVQLFASGGENYIWSPSQSLNNAATENPIASPSVTTTYTVTVSNSFGCVATDSVRIEVCDELIIPNGFSPDGDGVNDVFEIVGIERYPNNNLKIFNRWGNLVFEQDGYSNTWNGVVNTKGIVVGEKVPAATYYYILDLGDGSDKRASFLVIKY
ncbi:MAG: hypothetical protein RIQ89_1622, partial [Bacteroidota bacterium]